MSMTVNIHEAKTHLSRLVERAARGEEVIIAKAGRPVVKVVPLASPSTKRELGFLSGTAVIAADVKTAFTEEIEAMFALGRG